MENPHQGNADVECAELSDGTVTIEVSGGVVQNVYASPDLPPISVDLIDFDNLRDATDEEHTEASKRLHMVATHHKRIF